MAESKVGAVMVIGGGIGAIQSALDLADLGFKVEMIEKSGSFGGVMAQLDKTFPTNDCSMCILAPKMVEIARNPNIQLFPNSEVVNVEGEIGNFSVTIKQKPRYIDMTKCKNCGICALKCPVRVPDEFNQQLTVRSAIFIPFPQAVPSVYLIDADNCLYFKEGICKLCEKVCEVKAIDFDQREKLLTLKVGAIILATGSDLFNASILPQFGYRRFANVVTSIDFERILNASGPFAGHVVRPSDHTPPKKILWLNCIGSRTSKLKNHYCSSICCVYSIKEALITKEHHPDIECSIFFIDIRAVGKGFEEYYVGAKKSGLKFVKTRIASLEEDPITQNIIINYENTETGEVVEDIFDLVVLSIGYQPKDSTIELCKTLGINLNKYNFCETDPFHPLMTSKEGIYVCGTLSAPKDIPETVAEASGAAGIAASLLHTERYKLIVEKKYPPEINVGNQESRIGVFICHCGINIGGIVNVHEVVNFVKTLKHVVYAEENLYTCSQDTQDKIKQVIREYKLNRVVVASCTPRTHEPLFQNTVREAGLNPYLFELVNIREHCSWVHMTKPLEATQKAKKLVAMMVAKANLFESISEIAIGIKQAGLIIGGGIAGMTAALSLAKQGYQVYLVEIEKELGGFVRNIHYLLEEGDPQEYLQNLIASVKASSKITIFLGTTIESISGYLGNFKITTKNENEVKDIDVGAIIVATGGREDKPTKFLYGQDARILTQNELEQKITKNEIDAESIVMIQCVGSRDEIHPYCSKICCADAIKNALKLKSLNPDCQISILHKDIRTLGFKEEYYEKARELGINFIRFYDNNPPKIEIINSQIKISVIDAQSKEELLLNPDLVVLSAAFIPTDSRELSHMLKVPLDQNGFFLEAHVKLRPLDFATDGIFLCGTAQWPKFIKETIAQAEGAAARASKILAKDMIQIPKINASVNRDLCIGCGSCRDLCPYNAIEMQYIEKKLERASIFTYQAKVLEALCKGCGTCASACPLQAITIPHFTNAQILEMVEVLTKKTEAE